MKAKYSHQLILGLVFISGASALVYQVVWHRYLALLFGAQATATALCLTVFLGGMGIGYSLFGRWTYRRGSELVRLFCLMEFGLATWAIVFPGIFRAVGSHAGRFGEAFGSFSLIGDLLLAALLLGPPTILMGGTLPVLTQALSRNLASSSRIHARIYGWNTLGAFLGALVCGYVLLPSFSYPVILCLGAAGNLSVAIIVWLGFSSEKAVQKTSESAGNIKLQPYHYPLLITAFCSGFYIFSLQAVLVRMLGLAAGASYYNFSLVVAIFIFCLGMGSLRTNERHRQPRRLFWNQMKVAIGFIGILFSLNYWSYAAHVVRASLESFPTSFYVYLFLLALLLFAILSLPLLCAGRTMPLSFHLMRDDREALGVRVGQLYFWNTLGSISGAIIGGYVLLLYFNLDEVVRIAILLALFSATASLFIRGAASSRARLVLAPLPVLAAASLFFVPALKPERLVQAFRQQVAFDASFKGPEAFGEYLGRSANLLVWRDGPSSTIGIGSFPKKGKEISRTLFVNGKSDGDTRGDQLTTLLLGQIPGILATRLENAFVIGFGTGMSVAAIADFEEVKHVDVAEISEVLVKHASLFDPHNGSITRNPKVKLHQVDAFRFLNRAKRQYDVIISEPSNPWTSGVENVYTQEFYQAARDRLSSSGLVVQWVNTYAFTHELMRTVLKTMGTVFPVVRVFQLHAGDVAIVASSRDFDSQDFPRFEKRMNEKQIRHALSVLGIESLDEFLALEVIPPRGAEGIARTGEIHRTENPKLSFKAARAFFLRDMSDILQLRQDYKDYYLSVKDSLLVRRHGGQALDEAGLKQLERAFCHHPGGSGAGLCDQVQVARFSKSDSGAELRRANLPDHVKSDIFEIQWNGKENQKHQQSILQSAQYLDAIKRYYSPIFMPSRQTMASPIEICIESETKQNPTGTLLGECLIRKLAFLEMFSEGNQELIEAGAAYLRWFNRLDKNSPDYSRFLAASETLSRALLLLS